MMTSLRNASRRGTRIISFNPLRERALERFQAPQNPVEMVTLTSTPISTNIYQVRVGGDAAALRGMMKAVIEADEIALADDAPRIIDIDFINGHTMGFEDLAEDLRATWWEAFQREYGLSRGDLKMAALVYIEAHSVILVYGMGITQHRRGSETVQQICKSRAAPRQHRAARCRLVSGAWPLQPTGRSHSRDYREADARVSR